MILIITNKEDAHPTPVIERLSARGVLVFRLKPSRLWIGTAGPMLPGGYTPEQVAYTTNLSLHDQ